MTYEELKKVNCENRVKLGESKKIHIDSAILAKDKECIINGGSTVLIKDLVLSVLSRKIYLVNPSSLSSWNFKDGFTYKLLHHGSRSGLVGRISPKSRVSCDFGSAFYTAEREEFALSSALNGKGGTGYYYKLLCDLEGLSIYDFRDDTELWVLFTAYNRGYIDIEQYAKLKGKIAGLSQYDILKGLIADDRSAHSINSFLNNSITYECMLKCIQYFDLGCQYAFITQLACDRLKIVQQRVIKGGEYNEILRKYHKRIGSSDKIVEDLESEFGDNGVRFRQLLRKYK